MKLFLLIYLFSLSLQAQWVQKNSPAPEDEQISSIIIADNFILAATSYGAQGGRVYRSNNEGSSWEEVTSDLKGSEVRKLFLFSEGSISIYAATDSGVFKSTNYGEVWNDLSSGLSDKNITTVFKTENYLFAGSYSKIFRSTDEGLLWDEVSVGTSGQFISGIVRAGNNMFAGLNGNDNATAIVKSENFGLSWFTSDSGIAAYKIEAINNTVFYSYYSALYKSIDAGASWEHITSLQTYPISHLKGLGNQLFISSMIIGLHRLDPGSTTPVDISGNIPYPASILSFDINNEILVAGVFTFDEDQIWIRSASGVTSVSEDFISLANFILEQNFPNPFNPTTKINWQTSAGSWQTLNVYDILGNTVATLVNEYKPAGSYEVEFNAEGLTSGIYFYRLNAGNFVETRKMILLK